MNFSDLGLSPKLLQAISDTGYTTPTAIQSAAIGPVLEGKDLMASAQTGTGKTAAFTLPMLETLLRKPNSSKSPQFLIITPTRELAAQIEASAQTYSKYISCRTLAVFGGVKIGPQIRQLKQGVDVLIATPGRLLDLSEQGEVDLKMIDVLVLDEADRMLDMGFIPAIRRIQKLLPATKQTLMFSATYSDEIRTLAQTYLRRPVEVSVTPKNAAAHTVDQLIYPVDKKQKSAVLQYLLNNNGWVQVLVFSRTKHGANKLVRELDKANIRAAAIHGNRSQSQRTKALADFKSGKIAVLVATDIASRGIDIAQLPVVINFDLPNVPEDYVHRIGRTGRAGSNGRAISLVCADEVKQLRDIERVISRQLPREFVDGFTPQEPLPESPAKAKRPSSKPKSAPGRSRRSGQRCTHSAG